MFDNRSTRRQFVAGAAAVTSVAALAPFIARAAEPAKEEEAEAEGEEVAVEEEMADQDYMILEEHEDGSRLMNDSLGEVLVPEESFRLACTAPAQTSGLLLLGAVDKIVAVDATFANGAWIMSKYPQLAELAVPFASNETNVEELLNQNPDMVFYATRYGEETLAQLQELGIPCVGGMKQKDEEKIDYINRVRDNSVYYGYVVGGPQREAADNFREEYNAIRALIAERTADIPEDQRPTVCEISSAGEQLQVNNGGAIGQMLIDLAGGINAGKDAAGESAGPSGQTIIEPETLLNYNPDILICDKAAYLEALQGDEILSQLKAIQNGRVYIAPTGCMSWPYNGPEEYLNMYFFAKCIQPELFEDIDMEAETKAFYSKYFGFELDDEDMKMLFSLADGQTVADVFAK